MDELYRSFTRGRIPRSPERDSPPASQTPLTRDQMKRAVERRGGIIPRTPLCWIRFYNAETIAKYGERLTLHVGIDIQYLLPGGTTEEVAAGTRRLIDLCDRPEGGCLLAASNGIMPDTPLENIATFFKTAAEYGAEHRAKWC